MSRWAGLGLNIGSDLNSNVAYPTAEVTADLAYLKSVGITHLRIALADYGSAGGITNTQTLALAAKSLGFYVSYGLTCAGTLTSTIMNGAYQTAVLAQATWAQANGIDEFHMGNEMENHIDGTVTEQQVRTWVRAQATAVKTAGFTGKVSYCVGQGFANKSAGWVSDVGLGGLDYLSINVYGDYQNNWNLGFQYYLNQLIGAYSTGTVYVSEFNVFYTWTFPSMNMDAFSIAKEVGKRTAAVIASGVPRGNFFCWRFASDGFSAKRADGSLHPMWFAALGRRADFPTRGAIPLRSATLSRGATVSRGTI